MAEVLFKQKYYSFWQEWEILPDKVNELSLFPSKNLSDWSLFSFDKLLVSDEIEFCESSFISEFEKLSFFARHWIAQCSL